MFNSHEMLSREVVSFINKINQIISLSENCQKQHITTCAETDTNYRKSFLKKMCNVKN